MHKIDGADATPTNLFTRGDPSVGALATEMTDDWANAIQTEIVNVVQAAGIVLSKPNNSQLLAAIQIIAENATPAGQVAHFAVGTIPAGWLTCAGSAP